jgi:GTPase
LQLPVEPVGSTSLDVRSRPGRCTIDSIFSVPGAGTVVAGIVLGGPIAAGSNMLLGPTGVGEFIPVVVRSIEVNYVPFQVAQPGVSAAFAIRPRGKPFAGKRSWVRKGLHLVDPRLAPVAVWRFEAEVLILHHSTTVAVGYAPQCHIGVSSQSATITSITLRGRSDAGAAVSTGGAAATADSAESCTAVKPTESSALGGAFSAGSVVGPAGGSPGPRRAIEAAGIEAASPDAAAAALPGRDVLRTGNRALVTFQYLYKPEYIHVGEVLLFREGHCKGVGRITHVG